MQTYTHNAENEHAPFARGLKQAIAMALSGAAAGSTSRLLCQHHLLAAAVEFIFTPTHLLALPCRMQEHSNLSPEAVKLLLIHPC